MSNPIRPDSEATDENGQATDPPSKSQRKRDAHEFLALANRLLATGSSDIQRLELPDNIQAALREALVVKGNGARKRHTQFLAKLLRSQTDARTINETLDSGPVATPQAATAAPNPAQSDLEQLIDDPQRGLSALKTRYPTIELQRVRQLLKKIRHEPADASSAKARKTLLALLNEQHTNN